MTRKKPLFASIAGSLISAATAYYSFTVPNSDFSHPIVQWFSLFAAVSLAIISIKLQRAKDTVRTTGSPR